MQQAIRTSKGQRWRRWRRCGPRAARRNAATCELQQGGRGNITRQQGPELVPLLHISPWPISLFLSPANGATSFLVLILHSLDTPPPSFKIFSCVTSITHLEAGAMASMRRPAVPATAVSASPIHTDVALRSRFSDQSIDNKKTRPITQKITSKSDPKKDTARPRSPGTHNTITPIINISNNFTHHPSTSTTTITSGPVPSQDQGAALADELDYITVTTPALSSPNAPSQLRTDKASRILGIKHRRSMEPIPASARNSIVSTRSVRDVPPIASFVPSLPLTSLYVVSGLPKSPHTWTLADPDSVLGLHHSEGAVSRWWRPEVLGSTVSPGAGGGRKKKRGKSEEIMKGAGALSKQEVGKMLSKALKVRNFLFCSSESHRSSFRCSCHSPEKSRSLHQPFNPPQLFIPLPLPSLLRAPLWLLLLLGISSVPPS